MANIQPDLKDWSTTEASNQPDSTDPTTLVGDLRAILAGIRHYFSQDTIASAATTDLGSKRAGSLTISGTTTITALGTVSAGIKKTVVFSGALTLTHNATSLILPGGANITTAANDRAEMESLGSGNWRCNWYTKANGASILSVQDGDKGDVTVSSGVWTLDDTAITGKTAETSPAVDDLLLISDTSESAALNKMTLANMLKVVNVLTEDTSPALSTDFLLEYDASASSVKKVTPENAAKAALNASGSAPIYAVRAWANFNGTGTIAIRAAGNVGSLTDNGTGNYAVNMTTAQSDTNYAVNVTTTNASVDSSGTGSPSTTSVANVSSCVASLAADVAVLSVLITR